MGAGTTMDQGATELTNQSDSKPVSPGRGHDGGWSREPHHRRRRAIAVLTSLPLLTLLVVLLLASGGGSARRGSADDPLGLFARIETLERGDAGSAAAPEMAAENAAIDRTLAYTPYVRVAGSQHRELALTFDDGPGPYTPRIISILRRENVPATFFEVGVLERYFHASTSALASGGDAIEDHTFRHAPMSRLSPAEQRYELLRDAQMIEHYGAPFPRLFRPPYGLWNATTLALLREYRTLMVLWTVDTDDYRRPGVAAIVSTAVAGAKPGAIILLHDAGGNRAQTVAALPAIIARLRARGYRFVTVPRLLIDNPAPRDQEISAVIGSGG
jgi:peptidoglycan/xylan/chitin deacetylase (PgdA/CDA1 family)